MNRAIKNRIQKTEIITTIQQQGFKQKEQIAVNPNLIQPNFFNSNRRIYMVITQFKKVYK